MVPVLVGSLSPDKEARYGRIFAKYLADPQNLFIVSSDFCHWGSRFRYTEYDDSKGPIHEYIKHLDYEVRHPFLNDTTVLERAKIENNVVLMTPPHSVCEE